MKSDFFQFRIFTELSVGDVFKWNDKGVFYTVLTKNEFSSLIQTSFGKLRNYQITNSNAKWNKEVQCYPDKKRIFN